MYFLNVFLNMNSHIHPRFFNKIEQQHRLKFCYRAEVINIQMHYLYSFHENLHKNEQSF